MTAYALLADLTARGVTVALVADSIELDAPAGVLSDEDVSALRESKPHIIRLLRLAEGLPVDDDAARLLAMDEVDPGDIPECPSCGRAYDSQSLDDTWHCIRCDPRAESRHSSTARWHALVAECQTSNRPGKGYAKRGSPALEVVGASPG